MSELQALQDRIAQLEKAQTRVAQIETENLRLHAKSRTQSLRQRIGIGLAVIGLGLAMITNKASTQNADNGILYCRELRIQDADRNVIATLGSTPDAEGRLALYNSNAKQTINLSATKDTGAGGLWIFDEEGRVNASLSSNEGKGVLWTKK